MSKIVAEASKPRGFRFSTSDGFWSIIAGEDEYLACEYFKKEYGYSEARLRRDVRVDRLSHGFKVKIPYVMRPLTMAQILGCARPIPNWTRLTFLPRVVADADY